MDGMNLFAAAPEIVLAVAAMLVLVVDLSLDEGRRKVGYALSLAALVVVTAICGLFLAQDRVVYAFDGLYVTDPMAIVLKMFAAMATGVALLLRRGDVVNT